MYFRETENFAYGEINERSFSNPHPCTVPHICRLVDVVDVAFTIMEGILQYEFSCQCHHQSCNDLFLMLQPQLLRDVVEICHVNWGIANRQEEEEEEVENVGHAATTWSYSKKFTRYWHSMWMFANVLFKNVKKNKRDRNTLHWLNCDQYDSVEKCVTLLVTTTLDLICVIAVLSKVENPGSPIEPTMVDGWVICVTFGWSVYVVRSLKQLNSIVVMCYLFATSTKMVWDWYSMFSNRFQVWQAARQQWCQTACHVSK